MAGLDSVLGTVQLQSVAACSTWNASRPMQAFGNSTVTGDMTDHSDAADKTVFGAVRLTPVAWSATEGTMAPTSEPSSWQANSPLRRPAATRHSRRHGRVTVHLHRRTVIASTPTLYPLLTATADGDSDCHRHTTATMQRHQFRLHRQLRLVHRPCGLR